MVTVTGNARRRAPIATLLRAIGPWPKACLTAMAALRRVDSSGSPEGPKRSGGAAQPLDALMASRHPARLQSPSNTVKTTPSITVLTLINEHFQRAAEMLGNDSVAVRIGGVRALAELAAQHMDQYYISVANLLEAFALCPTRRNEHGDRADWHGDIQVDPPPLDWSTLRLPSHYRLRKRRDLRQLAVPGATSVIRHARRRKEIAGQRLRRMLAEKPAKPVAVALANKMARIVRAFTVTGESRRAPKVIGAVAGWGRSSREIGNTGHRGAHRRWSRPGAGRTANEAGANGR